MDAGKKIGEGILEREGNSQTSNAQGGDQRCNRYSEHTEHYKNADDINRPFENTVSKSCRRQREVGSLYVIPEYPTPKICDSCGKREYHNNMNCLIEIVGILLGHF